MQHIRIACMSFHQVIEGACFVLDASENRERGRGGEGGSGRGGEWETEFSSAAGTY